MLRGLAHALCVAALVYVPGCGGEGLRYEGRTGQTIALTLDGWVPGVEAHVDSGAPLGLLVDSGAPVTLLGPPAGLGAGRRDIDLQAFGLRFGRLPVVVGDSALPASPCATRLPAGLLGADVLAHFALALDYAARRGALLGATDDDVAHAPADTEAAVEVPLEVLGGGRLPVAGGDAVEVPATRAVLSVDVEGQKVAAIVDTGASFSVVDTRLFGALPARATLCCQRVGTIAGTVNAKLARVRTLGLGPLLLEGMPVLVLDDPRLLDSLSEETGRPIRMLLGGSLIRAFGTLLDYPRRRLVLRRYRDVAQTQPDEFVLPGFSFCRPPGAKHLLVVDVYAGRSAATAGVSAGEQVSAIDGQAVGELSPAQLTRLLVERLDRTVRVDFLRGAGSTQRELRVERLLP